MKNIKKKVFNLEVILYNHNLVLIYFSGMDMEYGPIKCN